MREYTHLERYAICHRGKRTHFSSIYKLHLRGELEHSCKLRTFSFCGGLKNFQPDSLTCTREGCNDICWKNPFLVQNQWQLQQLIKLRSVRERQMRLNGPNRIATMTFAFHLKFSHHVSKIIAFGTDTILLI